MNLKLAFRLARVLLHLIEGLAVCGLLFPWMGGARRDAVTARYCARLLRICGVQVVHRAGPHALAHAMIVANHVSWLDIFLINALHPSRFVAKSEIRDWPVLGWLVDKAGTVFIARGNRRELRHIFKGMVSALQRGERVAFFPEGTTAAQGVMMPFHANLFEAAVDAKVPVQPYALRYVDGAGALHAAVDFSGEITFAQSIRMVLSADGICAELLCLPALPAGGAHRRDLARAAHDAIAAALTG